MNLRLALLATMGSLFLVATPAQAFCEYGGVLDAKTTIPQEFRDSTWVVHARVIAAKTHWPHIEGDLGGTDGEPWTVYDLQVLKSYKGQPPRPLRFFTLRNSGAFYMDADPRLGIRGEYLLFLVPYRRSYRAAQGTVFVNYPCGQSKSWREVSHAERQSLERLSAEVRR